MIQGQLSHENPSDLIDGNMYELDNTQVFNGTVTLNELRLVSQAMGEILVRYKLFSVSLIVTLSSNTPTIPNVELR